MNKEVFKRERETDRVRVAESERHRETECVCGAGGGGERQTERGRGEETKPTLHTHYINDSALKTGSDESQYVSLIVMGKVTRQSPTNPSFLKEK